MTLRDIFMSGPRPLWIRWLFLIGLVAAITRAVLDSRFGTTGLFYVGVPYLIGLMIYIFIPPSKVMSKGARAGRHFRAASIVMLASSALLFEGFLCVIFAFPIYILFAGIVLALMPPPKGTFEDLSDIFRSSWVPLCVVILSLEGLTPALSFEREHSVTRTQLVSSTVPQIHAKLAEPITFTETRSAFLSLFPLPHKVEAGTLTKGDIHRSHFTYKKWPIGNTHKGTTDILIAEVTPHHIQTKVMSDDSYFANYLTVHGTDIRLTPMEDGQTEISLTIHYRRDLDPAWYFGPMQRKAIGESADYLISQIMTP